MKIQRMDEIDVEINITIVVTILNCKYVMNDIQFVIQNVKCICTLWYLPSIMGVKCLIL